MHIGVLVMAFMSIMPCVVLIARPRKDSEALFWTLWLLILVIVGVLMLMQLPRPKIFGGEYRGAVGGADSPEMWLCVMGDCVSGLSNPR